MQEKRSIEYWSLPQDEVLRSVRSNVNGLTAAEAAARLRQYGENTLRKQKKDTQLLAFLSQFKSPIILILLVATGISAATGEWIDAMIILGIILVSAILSFYQEYTAGNVIAELRAKVQAKSVVLREGKPIEIASKEVVPGDIIKLSIGSLIVADGLILESENLFVNQSILTGESLPSEKKPDKVNEDASMEERTNCVYTGTSVQSGNATMLVVETGASTEFGQIADKLALRPPETDFERGVRRFGYLLTEIMLVLTLIVFAINVIMNRPAIEALLFSVALAVGITPQLLPAIISITLSKGSRIMAKEGVIVRRLTAIENFGSMDILCTDKTGTLTEGTIRLDGAAGVDGQPSDEVFWLAYLNAKLQTGMANTLDDAISAAKDLDISAIKKQAEIPFDFNRERLSIIVQETDQCLMIAKGGLNSILAVCTQVEIAGCGKAMDEQTLSVIQQHYEEWSSQGIRIIAVAKKTVALQQQYTVEDEADMILMGFLLLFDHPKEDVSRTITDLKNQGVSLRVITGDNKLIALHTAEAVGLEVTGVLTGSELMRLSDEALWSKIEATTVFAEVDPNQKERIILALKKQNHVVGYMGDGINDVPALHAADVSLSVENAVDVAKESADFVLVEKSLKVLSRGIELGRTTFANTLKYIQVTTSANFGNMFSMAGASLFLPFLPLLPKQILLINFLSDFPAITIANDSVDKEIVARPLRWDIHFIRDFMIVFGLVSSIFDYLTFAVLFFGFNAKHGIFQSSWFTISVLTELLVLLVMRTQKRFYRSRPAPLLLYSSIAVGIFTLLIPYLPFHQYLGIEPVKPLLLFSLFFILALYVIVTEIAKYYFYNAKAQPKHGKFRS
ncbi:magnesium-translocating P-type ATPase [Trichococcus ilyis]|jgi:Mg2+-importing ATPase|uniref:Magnesium-transporting ATPase, P-type 1 n=1 Tax=Trichococcus ilyis TaxID=640938 RepID=A0A143YJD3_9LACT|nr:magnesium-translocating P-type ATPase [Trichococcus ilyis]CZQ90799.1 p-type atpase phosphorylation site [Trichococcus ilyis]SEI71955.1 Mg2+-importing ATPase [Trichococcus ilyis]